MAEDERHKFFNTAVKRWILKIVYPYNEILPKKTAHDVYIFDECAALANAGCDVALLCGKGSAEDEALFRHYHVPDNLFHIERLPIVRKNNPFNISWNYPFFLFSQQAIRKLKPDWVFLSVRKQGAYHLRRKIKGIRYVYEAHELAFYPYMIDRPGDFAVDKAMLACADLITVTTEALKHILLAPPYSIKIPIEVVPLAVKKEPLPPPPNVENPLTLMYIGQLYEGQGVASLIAAAALVDGVCLKIAGGREGEILRMKEIAARLNCANRMEFLGFLPPSELSHAAKEAHVFVAPFDRSGRMPYVAHTKLFEYAQWGRPIIAPDMPTVREHFSEGSGALLFEPENTEDLARCIRLLKQKEIRSQLQREIALHRGRFSWESRAACYQRLLNAGS